MSLKRICSMILAILLVASAVGIIPTYGAAGDTVLVIWEKAMELPSLRTESADMVKRPHDGNAAHLTWGTGEEMKILFQTENPADKINVSDYQYINAWMYNPEVKKNSDGNISALPWILRTGESKDDVSQLGYFRYPISMDWTGWKLVSVPLANFSARNGNSKLSYGLYAVSFDPNGWRGDTPWWSDSDNSVDIDAMWLSKEKPEAGALTIVGQEYENGIGYVPADLGGDNAFCFTMSRQLFSEIAIDTITVMQEDQPLSGGYAATAEGNELYVAFDQPLAAGKTYKIVIQPFLQDIYGNRPETVWSTEFTVEAPSRNFWVSSLSIENGAKNVPVDLGGERSYIVTFNNPIANDGLKKAVLILKNGLAVQDGYIAAAEENAIVITMDDDLEYAAVYEIVLSDTFCDAYGHPLLGERRFAFTTAAQPQEDMILWKSGLSLPADSGLVEVSEHNRLGDSSARFCWGTENAYVWFYNTSSPEEKIPVTEYRYLNAWIYNPEIKRSNDGKISALNWLLRTGNTPSDTSGMYYHRYELSMDWTGWKLVSVPIANFSPGSGSNLEFGLYGVTLEANGWTSITPPWVEEQNYLDVDVMWFSKTRPGTDTVSYLGSSLPADYEDMPVCDVAVELVYTNRLSPPGAGIVSVKCNGAESAAAIQTGIENNRLTVVFTEDLEYDTAYTITVDDTLLDTLGQPLAVPTSYRFRTMKKGLSISRPVFQSESGEPLTELPEIGSSVKVVARAVNPMEERTAVLMAAQYNATGDMIDCVTDSQSVSGENALSVVLERQPETVAIYAVVCDENGVLLRTDYGVIGADAHAEKRVYDAASVVQAVSLEQAELSIDRLAISGKCGIGAALIRVTEEGGQDVFALPVNSNQDGMFHLTYVFGETLSSGKYTVSAAVAGKPAVSKTVFYYDQNERNEQLTVINNGTAAEINEILLAGRDSFGLTGLRTSEIDAVAQVLHEQRPYVDYDAMCAMCRQAKTILKTMEDTKWSGMSEFLKDTHVVVLFENKEYSYYSDLSVKNQNQINREMEHWLPVYSFAEFRTIFSDAVAQYRLGKPGNASSGGGGSGGTSRPSGSGTGGANLQFAQEIVDRYTSDRKMTNAHVFDDLETCSWAVESIEALYRLGIVSPAEDRRFRPDEAITREEFVKLLVAAFGLPLSQGESGFTDMQENAWYRPYLATAREHGMISGNPDGSFGVGQPITRQDMAVMAYRTVSGLHSTLNEEQSPSVFLDVTDIAAYAAEAVTEMQRAGIIHGMGDGWFRPLNHTTRAQAAMVITALLSVAQ